MNENLVMEEDTIYEVDPVCMKQREKNKKNINREKKDSVKKADYNKNNHNDMWFLMVLLFLMFR